MNKRLFITAVTALVLALCIIALAIESASAEFSVVIWRGTAENYYHYNPISGKRERITIEDAVIAYVYIANCEASEVHSGVVELYYDTEVLECVAFKSFVGGTWAVNVDVPGRVRMAFSTGAEETEDGVILAAAFTYLEEPETGDTTGFTIDVPELCNDANPAVPAPSDTASESGSATPSGSAGGNDVPYVAPDPAEEIPYEYDEPNPTPPPLKPDPDPTKEPGATEDPSHTSDPAIGKTGDVSGDGNINTADAVQVLKYSASMIELDLNQLHRADTNGDGKVNTADAVLILKFSAGMITEF